jgi:hypothetical protein
VRSTARHRSAWAAARAASSSRECLTALLNAPPPKNVDPYRAVRSPRTHGALPRQQPAVVRCRQPRRPFEHAAARASPCCQSRWQRAVSAVSGRGLEPANVARPRCARTDSRRKLAVKKCPGRCGESGG